jgi:chromosome segregation ATPase
MAPEARKADEERRLEEDCEEGEKGSREQMTAEEIERTLQSVALSIQQLSQVAVRTDARLDASDSVRRETDERIEALINAQVRFEARQEKLEEAFRLVAQSHAQLVEMIQIHENRLDGQDQAQERTDGRLDALIDDQISARSQAEERGRILDGKLARLSEAQARADEQIRMLAAGAGGAE